VAIVATARFRVLAHVSLDFLVAFPAVLFRGIIATLAKIHDLAIIVIFSDFLDHDTSIRSRHYQWIGVRRVLHFRLFYLRLFYATIA